MSSHNSMPMGYNHSMSTIDEHKWLSLVRSSFSVISNEEDQKVKVKISIFFVPKNLLYLKPEAFMPQLFAFGPYHHWVPHLYDMERYKLAAARKMQGDLISPTIDDLVSCFLKHENRIRAHYHKYLDFTGETLAWMMVIDTSFLLQFLRNFKAEEAEEVSLDKKKLSQWDAPRMRMAYKAITRDIIMLENQIPLFLLRKTLSRCRQFSSPNLAEEELSEMLTGFMNDVSPFTIASNITLNDSQQDDHILQLLYSMIVPKLSEEEFNNSIQIDLIDAIHSKEEDANFADGGPVWKVYNTVWTYLSNLNDGATMNKIKAFVIKGPIKLLIKLPWKIISSFPGISALKQPIESLLLHGAGKKKDDDEDDKVAAVSKPPSVDEIAIPSVTELTEAGVMFMPSNGDMTTISFDGQQKPATIYLPTVSLDMNTEVVLRNLVAYEASAVHGPMLLTRYTELMNGIIDTEKDVKILRERGLIVNRMKSDKEVADIWNGMSRCDKPSRVEFMDKFLKDVNSYYDNRFKVKAKRFIKKYVFESWQFLTLLATIVLLLLTCLQTFCNVYNCGDRWFVVQKD